MNESGEPVAAGTRRAVVLGATGAVGSALVRELLTSPAWSSVMLLVRRPTSAFDDIGPPGKALVRQIDMARLEQDVRAHLAAAGWDGAAGNAVSAFSTLGIGQPRKVSAEELRNVDVGSAAAFARACSDAGVAHLSLLTSVGANARAPWHYLRVKADAEAAVRAAGLPRASFFRPSLLVTPEARFGWTDRVNQWIFPRLSKVLPSRYRAIRIEDLARAMRINAERAGSGVEILHHADYAALLGAPGAGR